MHFAEIMHSRITWEYYVKLIFDIFAIVVLHIIICRYVQVGLAFCSWVMLCLWEMRGTNVIHSINAYLSVTIISTLHSANRKTNWSFIYIYFILIHFLCAEHINTLNYVNKMKKKQKKWGKNSQSSRYN